MPIRFLPKMHLCCSLCSTLFTEMWIGEPDTPHVIAILNDLSSEAEWQKIISSMDTSLKAQQSVPEFVRSLGLERAVSGYSLHVVPVAIYAWLRHPRDFRKALISALNCGGDTDTVGAIVGALVGATCGKRNLPTEWLNAIWEWPCSLQAIGRIAERLAEQKLGDDPSGSVHYFWPGQILRNLLFLVTILFHGFRRLAPPY